MTTTPEAPGYETRWIELDGAANVRDVGGLPLRDGGTVAAASADPLGEPAAPHRSATSTVLVDEHDVRTVADLRTGVEVDLEGPGPLHERDDVEIRHLSLFPESGESHGRRGGPARWCCRGRTIRSATSALAGGTSAVYFGYLEDRADSIVAALRLIANAPGATLVHCAAGKDRTGVVVALALDEVGVERDAIADDYARTAERIEEIFAALRNSKTYVGDVGSRDVSKHTPQAATIERLLAVVDEQFGGTSAWLRSHGWTDEDAAALRAKLTADKLGR